MVKLQCDANTLATVGTSGLCYGSLHLVHVFYHTIFPYNTFFFSFFRVRIGGEKVPNLSYVLLSDTE